MNPSLDIVIPVYNEGANILATLRGLRRAVKTPARILICYDMPEDDTLSTIRNNPEGIADLKIEFIRNAGRGAHRAVMTGFAASTAPFVVVFPADDESNAAILDVMVAAAADGCDIVCASRFMPGGSMVGCPLLKAILVRSGNFTLYHLAGVPTRDASNGFRLFSRRVLDTVAVESDEGFCYSIELLVKCHRLGWSVHEVPANWSERSQGKSRFRVIAWLGSYLRWYFYAFATMLLRQPASTVRLKPASPPMDRR